MSYNILFFFLYIFYYHYPSWRLLHNVSQADSKENREEGMSKKNVLDLIYLCCFQVAPFGQVSER